MSDATAAHDADVPERFDPATMHGQLVEAEHLLRYWFAADLAAGRTVLDAGCGLAYGTAALAAAGAERVVGVDLAQGALDAAGAMPDNVELLAADVRSLPFDDDTFDLVVCFEVIEHVAEQDRVLDELARVARDDAIVLVSSPNRDRYVEGNPHHVREYLPGELQAALAERFSHVALARQHAAAATLLVADQDLGARGPGALSAGTVGSLLDLRPDDEIYTVAVAGNRELPSVAPAVCLGSPVEIRRWVELYAGQHRQLAAQAESLRELEAVAEQRRRLAQQLADAEQDVARVIELEEALQELRETHNQLIDDYNELEQHLVNARNVIDDVTTSASWRITSPLRAAKQRVRSSS